MSPIFGLLNIHKPPGLTSRRVVDHVQRLVRPAKAGHAGTLDPMATGVLVVCVGGATRLISCVQEQAKVYRAKFLLGRRSDTDDVTGAVVETAGCMPVTREQLAALLPEFTGRIAQVPPQFSAVHVGGERAYKLARRGEAVGIAARTVEIVRLELLSFEWPEFALEIECGSGAYVRSIGRDLGERLGCGAVMSELVRTRIGPFRIEDAVTPEELTAESLPRHLLPAAAAVSHLRQYECEAGDLEAIRRGRGVRCESLDGGLGGGMVAVIAPDGGLACLAEYDAGRGVLLPRQVFLGPAK